MSTTSERQGKDIIGRADLRAAITDLFVTAMAALPSDEILILCDESLQRYQELFEEVAISLALSFTSIHIPRQQQRYLANKIASDRETDWIPRTIRSAISSATVILSLLDGTLATGAVRRALLQQPRLRGARLAHIPGLSDEILAIVARTNFNQVLADCELVAWVLGQSEKGKIITETNSGMQCVLSLDLGGWDNEPFMSPGIIPPGSWGNFPPGEVFCCPEPGEVSGTICINGSLPLMVLNPAQEIILRFEKGRLLDWSGSDAADARRFFSDLKRLSDERGDSNWNVLAELGIGLNPAVQELTGNSLFDEKAANTLHIAIGDNTTFGATIKADIHADLVTRNASLMIGGQNVLQNGELQLDSLTHYRASWKPPKAALSPSARLWLKEAEVDVEGGILRRRLSRAGRVGYVTMASEAIGIALAQLADRMRRPESVALHEILEDQPTINGHATRQLLDWLIHYRCLIVSA